MYERVNLKRFVAAIFDAIVLGIIVAIPTVIYTLTTGLDNITNALAGSFNPAGGGSVLGTTTELIQYSAVVTTVSVLISIVWFVWIPAKWNGQTPGKKLLSIKVIDEEGNNPTLKQHFLRSVQNWSGYVSVPVLLIGFVSISAYDILNITVVNGVGLLAFISYLMVLFKTDGRGLHDIISNTTVVKADINLNQTFQEKAAQLGDWAEVETEQTATEEEDEWKY